MATWSKLSVATLEKTSNMSWDLSNSGPKSDESNIQVWHGLQMLWNETNFRILGAKNPGSIRVSLCVVELCRLSSELRPFCRILDPSCWIHYVVMWTHASWLFFHHWKMESNEANAETWTRVAQIVVVHDFLLWVCFTISLYLPFVCPHCFSAISMLWILIQCHYCMGASTVVHLEVEIQRVLLNLTWQKANR